MDDTRRRRLRGRAITVSLLGLGTAALAVFAQVLGLETCFGFSRPSAQAHGQAQSHATSLASLGFEAREVGSAEQLMLSRMPAGHMVSTHTFAAILRGSVQPKLLLDALKWSILRHPMLRAVADPPSRERSDETGPFVHAGKDGRWTWRPSPLAVEDIADRAMQVVEVTGDFAATVNLQVEQLLDRSTFDFEAGPLWRVLLMKGASATGAQSALVFCFVHALDDQRSGNILLHDLLSHMAAAEQAIELPPPEPLPLPKSIEEVFLQDEVDIIRLAQYGLFQTSNGGQSSVILPSAFRSQERSLRKHWALAPKQPTASQRPLVVPTLPATGNRKLLMPVSVDEESVFSVEKRRNLVSLRKLPAEVLNQLRQRCRENNVTVSMAVAAATLLAISDLGHDQLDYGYEIYRLLLSVDMRRFAPKGDWTGGTVAYASGALDFTARVLPGSATAFAEEFENPSSRSPIGGVPFWELAAAAADATNSWVEKGYAAESTRLFDLGTRMLRMENIIYENAHDPSTLGRAYSVTVSNVGLYEHGSADATYGSLQLQGIYFGISQAVTGSMTAVSCLTVAGELHLTAIGATPFVNRSDLDAFAEAMIRSLTIASASSSARPKPENRKPRTDYPVDVRGGMPWFYPLETPKGNLRCPRYEEVKSSTMPRFDIEKYVGVWYELAFHDITQFNGCGCTQFNMTLHGSIVEDMFTVTCPWPWRDGVEGPWLPGYSKITGQRQLNQWSCNMTMYVNQMQPGVMRETGFSQEFDNMVLEIWRDPEIQAQTGFEFTRAIQFQCLGGGNDGEVTFTGINFLSRVPIVAPTMLQEMFVRARALGLEPYGSNDMHVVEHEGCRYPKSTDRSWMGERPEWPCPIFDRELGAGI